MNRSEILKGLQARPAISVLIVGAGINGIGTFRDLALNGVDVLLVDRADFCSGASSASSHMAHGGIRYLENGEFRLVREAVQERNRLIENAPHVVRPLPTIIPIFKFWSGLLNAPLKFFNLLERPAERGAAVIKLGLIFYDGFTKGQGTVPTHQFEGRRRSLEKYPRLNPEVRYTATYFDGQILSPERLSVELVLDAEAEGEHARALNYVSVEAGAGGQVTLRDELTGGSFDVQPRLIVNAAGPWIDVVNAQLGLSHRYIGGTKGSHLVLNHPELRAAIGKNEFFFENKDGRIVLIFPFYDKVIIGTSDIPVDDADAVHCTEEEIDYFIALVARVFPDIPVGREHIVFQFSGVRPLAYSHAKTAGQITRDHLVHEDRLGDIPVYSLVGGKWTTYRAFAEQVTDRVLGVLGRVRKADTRALAVGGGRDYPLVGYAQIEFIKQVADETGLGNLQPKRLFERYGTRALEIARIISADEDEELKTLPGWSRREVEFLVVREKAMHLDDLLLRRTTLGWLGMLTRPVIEELGEIMGRPLGWSAAQRQTEVDRAVDLLRDRHGVRL